MQNTILNLTAEEKLKIEKDIGPLKSISGFCSDLVEATKEIHLKETLGALLPWAVKGGEILSEITPLTKALVKVVDEVAKEKDPEILGLLACSLAYQRSAALALAQQGEPHNRVPLQESLKRAKDDLKKFQINASLAGFTLEAPLAHPFIWQADEVLSLVVRGAGYDETEWRQVQSRIHEKFCTDLVEVLSHGESAARFEPFTKRLSLGDTTAAHAALNAHVERQRRLFENRPVLNVEPFALKDVYVDTDCGKLRWKDFSSRSEAKRDASGEKFDPFSESFGGRHPLLETVLEYLRDPRFNDAVVIQGAPGCGKSSFTLRLANALRRQGLRPLRIRLKFLDLKKSLSEALAQVVLQPEEDEDQDLARLPKCSDPFLSDSIFDEKTTFGTAEICPNVLILDGWDEISVAVNEGFEIEVHRMLDNIRREFLRPRNAKVRVVLTGRPSNAVERSQFLRDDTPVLTIREYTPDQLEDYASKVRTVLERMVSLSGQSWGEVSWENVRIAFASYREDRAKLDILGLPLLAHLSLRLLTQWQGGSERLLSDRTALYRHLLDVTCLKAGKSPSDPDDLLGQARVKGLELRKMLQQTAVAITSHGNESIPFRELQLRLEMDSDQAMESVESAGKEHPLTSLMISFYFKGGREHLGCEFLHKSFREYLYAEAVIEVLKDYSRRQFGSPPKREPYWKDFQESDQRHRFSRELSRILCPRPLTGEISTHLSNLLAWEIERPNKTEPEQIGEALDAVTSAHWETIRDGLADLWDWWGEGVHLRPQPFRDKSRNLDYREAFVNELMDFALPLYRGPDALEWWPGRFVNADANVGEALFQLNAWVHSNLLRVSGWRDLLKNYKEALEMPTNATRNAYQSRLHYSNRTFIVFRPSGPDVEYFLNYCSRINASGNRRGTQFPSELDLADIDLRETYLNGVEFVGTILDRAILREVRANRADFQLASMVETDLRGAFFNSTYLSHAILSRADLRSSHAGNSDFTSCSLADADLEGAKMDRADFTYATLDRANLVAASLQHADFDESSLVDANCSNANLSGADLRNATLQNANFAQAVIFDAKFNHPPTENADKPINNG